MENELDKQIQAAEQEWLALWQKGPMRTRWTKTPLQPGDPAPDFELLDASGKTVHLSDYWKSGPALLMFWRHYGCSCGMDRARRLGTEYMDYVKAGGTPVIIGQGEPERAAVYAQKNDIPCTVLCDPAYKAYQAYDLLEGLPAQVFFDASDALLRCEPSAGVEFAKSRHRSDRALVDSPWQLPGEFVVDQKGVIRLAYRYQYCEDWPNPLVLLGAIKDAVWKK